MSKDGKGQSSVLGSSLSSRIRSISLRKKLNKTFSQQVSAGLQLKFQQKHFSRSRASFDVKNAVLSALGGEAQFRRNDMMIAFNRLTLEAMKELSPAVEKELQDHIISLLKRMGEYEGGIFKVADEIYVKKNNGKNGRIDVLLVEGNETIIIELKRSIFKNSEGNLSKLKYQVNGYDTRKTLWCPSNIRKGFAMPTLATKRMTISGKHNERNDLKTISGNSAELKMYSWDVWLAEFERIYL